jgi:hypothetical protein
VIWVGWRQQRTETLITAAILAVLTLALLPSALHMASVYHDDGLAGCLGSRPGPTCEEAIRSFTSRFESLDNFVAWATILPGLIGVLLATPFVLDLEHGTYRLAWTQSITRRRWIASKLGLAVAVALVAAVVLTTFLTWWRQPLIRLNGRMEGPEFDSTGTVVAGYVLFALGLALALGVIWRRAVPALVVAFAGYMAARIFVETWLRQYLVPQVSAVWQARGPEPSSLHHAWVLTEEPSDKFGHAIAPTLSFCSRAQLDAGRCPAFKHPPDYVHAVYITADRFWELQGIETAMFGCVALVLLALAAWWTHERVS